MRHDSAQIRQRALLTCVHRATHSSDAKIKRERNVAQIDIFIQCIGINVTPCMNSSTVNTKDETKCNQQLTNDDDDDEKKRENNSTRHTTTETN